ncbi:MAG: hypothetical protein ACRD1Z_05080 [Vicinamibacteria bacterium]
MNEKTMHEALGRIVDAGRQELNRIISHVEGAQERAREAVRKADEEMKALVQFAESVPAAIFDRFSSVFIGTFEIHDDSLRYADDSLRYADIRLELNNGCPFVPLRQAFGGTFKKGRYRAIVTFERTE